MEQLLTILDPVAVLIVVTSTMGAVELIKRLFKDDYEAAAIIATSAVTGAIMSLPLGVSWYYGLVLGLGASGLITIATKTSNVGVQINKSNKE